MKNTIHYKNNTDGTRSFVRAGYHNVWDHEMTVYEHPVASLIVLVVCGAVDLTNFISLFLSFSADSAAMIVVSTAGLFIGFDLIPIYLGVSLKEKNEGYRENATMIYIGFGFMALAVAANIYLRFSAADLVLPQTEDIVTGEFTPNKMRYAYSAMLCLVSLLTTFLSFFVSYKSYRPTVADYKRTCKALDQTYELLNSDIQIIDDIEKDSDYRKNLEKRNKASLDCALDELSARTIYAALYIRNAIKAKCSNPEDMSALSSPDETDYIEAKLDVLADNIQKRIKSEESL